MKSASKKDKGAASDAAAKAEPQKKVKAAVAKRGPAPAAASPKVAVTKKKPVSAEATTSPVKAKTKVSTPKAPKAVTTVKPKVAAAEKDVTTLIINANVGLGNTVFVRGWGGGLRWDSGVPAKCISPDMWELKLQGAAEVVYCKVLINDQVWCEGPDLPAMPGEATTFNPAFG